jgi:hypothetical protein
MRDYYLLSGRHSACQDLPFGPNYWWPDDRAWCVCTDTDFDWAYVAGSASSTEEVLSVPVLDAYQTRPENPAAAGMDVINDPGQTVAGDLMRTCLMGRAPDHDAALAAARSVPRWRSVADLRWKASQRR